MNWRTYQAAEQIKQQRYKTLQRDISMFPRTAVVVDVEESRGSTGAAECLGSGVDKASTPALAQVLKKLVGLSRVGASGGPGRDAIAGVTRITEPRFEDLDGLANRANNNVDFLFANNSLLGLYKHIENTSTIGKLLHCHFAKKVKL